MKHLIHGIRGYSTSERLHLACWLDMHRDDKNPPTYDWQGTPGKHTYPVYIDDIPSARLGYKYGVQL